MTEARWFPRALLARAVAPARLESVLEGLLVGGLLVSFERDGDDGMVLVGDFRGLEAALAMRDQVEQHEPPAPTPIADHRGDYYRACRSYVDTASFRRLSPLHRAIWRLHADGQSHQVIAHRLGITLMRVRVAVRGARLAARLPSVASVMPRGGGAGRPAGAESGQRRCTCGRVLKWRNGVRGMCMPCYLRAWRQKTLPDRETGT